MKVTRMEHWPHVRASSRGWITGGMSPLASSLHSDETQAEWGMHKGWVDGKDTGSFQKHCMGWVDGKHRQSFQSLCISVLSMRGKDARTGGWVG